jgi:putative DNA primase/helicase
MTASKYRAAAATGFRIDPSDPYAVALAFLIAESYAGGQRTLHHHRGVFYAWNGSAYLEITRDEIRSWLYAFLDRCIAGSGQGQKVKPNTALVNSVLDALTARTELDNAISAPCWLNEDHSLPATEIIACKNGLLYLPRLALLPHTPNFFTHNALDYAFDPQKRHRQLNGWSSYVSFGPMIRNPSRPYKKSSATAWSGIPVSKRLS